MINSDYRVEAILWLLSEECIPARYYPLIPYKLEIVARLKIMGCSRKQEVERLGDEALHTMCLPDLQSVALFRNFLAMYDVNQKKMDKLSGIKCSKEEKHALMDLCLLPGISFTRGDLYFRAGYCTLESFASSEPEEILEKTKKTIEAQQLDCKAPFMKEIRTHIAVSRAFTDYIWPHYQKDALTKRVVEDGRLRIRNWIYFAPSKDRKDEGNIVACRMTDILSGAFIEWGLDAEGRPYERDETGQKHMTLESFAGQIDKLQQVVAGTEIESWSDIYKELAQRARLQRAYDVAAVGGLDLPFHP